MAHILGDLRTQPRCGLPVEYFVQRDCFLDCREPDALIISPEANFGWEVKLVTQTHDTALGMFGRVTGRKIVIEKHAWIASFAVLYNCTIGEGAIVALGSVVRSQNVPPWTMVAGNPAVPIKRLNPATGKWEPS